MLEFVCASFHSKVFFNKDKSQSINSTDKYHFVNITIPNNNKGYAMIELLSILESKGIHGLKPNSVLDISSEFPRYIMDSIYLDIAKVGCKYSGKSIEVCIDRIYGREQDACYLTNPTKYQLDLGYNPTLQDLLNRCFFND
tara:strand:- start:6222 stop:6644 length:423 start_codon:yes stop_codon:yes gene_type:complete